MLSRQLRNDFVSKSPALARIIDANVNRAKEGLRVCEEIARFLLNNRLLTLQLKRLRHRIDALVVYLPPKELLLRGRRARADVGRPADSYELRRKGYEDLFFANIQRVKESLRVLEEFAKLNNVSGSVRFKRLRYDVYELEKKIVERFASLSHR